MKKYKILFVARDDGGCGFFRCKQPADFLKRSGLADAEYVLRTPTHEQLLRADLVVMQELGSPEGGSMRKFMRENNIPYITEFDDFIFHVSPHNVAGYGAWNPGTLYVHRSVEMAKGGVGMIVSTPTLARELFPYNNNIFVVPNYLDKDKWDHPAVKRNDGKIRIGWCGGNAHADDLKMVANVLDEIVKEYKGKVVFETLGMLRQELMGVFPLRDHSEVCPSCGHEGEIHHYPGESLDNYPMVLAGRGWDIAIAPVINNSFGNAKSDLKIKEYAATGLPIIASDVAPYREAVKNGAIVHLATTYDEWYKAIKDLIEDAELRHKIATENKQWIQKNWIQENIVHMYEIFKQIIQASEPVLGISEDRMKKNNLL